MYMIIIHITHDMYCKRALTFFSGKESFVRIVGFVPLCLPLSQWAQLWLTLVVGHLVIARSGSRSCGTLNRRK
jgi:hypothetical protein